MSAAMLDTQFFFAGPGYPAVVALLASGGLDIYYRWHEPKLNTLRFLVTSGVTGLVTGLLICVAALAWLAGAISSGVLVVVTLVFPMTLAVVGEALHRTKAYRLAAANARGSRHLLAQTRRK